MAYLVMSSDRTLKNSILIKEASLEEIDKYTTKYYDSKGICNSNKSLMKTFFSKFGYDQKLAVRLFEQDGAEKKVLYRKHKFAFKQIIDNYDLVSELVKFKRDLVSQYYYYYFSRRYHIPTNIKKMLKELKDQNTYYKFMRNTLNTYDRLCYNRKNLLSLKQLYSQYEKLIKDKNGIVSEEQLTIPINHSDFYLNQKEEFLTSDEINSMYDCDDDSQIVFLDIFSVLDPKEYVYLFGDTEFMIENNFSIENILNQCTDPYIINGDNVGLDEIRDINRMALLIANIDASKFKYASIVLLAARYNIPILFIGNKVNKRKKTYMECGYPFAKVLDFNNPHFKKQITDYFNNLYNQWNYNNMQNDSELNEKYYK